MKLFKTTKIDTPAQELSNPLDIAVARRDSDVLATVRAAVKHGEAMLAYQPVMRSASPHATGFYEGLLRVMDATGRVIPAREFMPAVAKAELGRDLDVLALDLGMKTLAENPAVRLSLNLSARSIGYAAWMQTLERHLSKNETLGERLMLEITEESAMDMPELVISFMDRLQPMGIAFALDEFGAGTTRFARFREFFFDAVKIDGQYIRDLADSPDNQVLVRAMIAVARQFEMMVIATSVERLEDAELLIDMGVDCLQGFLFGAPALNPPWLDASGDRARA
ncbi:MAG: EAL domain-containing protein [Pseudomonadota bacterium]|nr:EAL domain-containing protein [Pseudomonadota bacterium]